MQIKDKHKVIRNSTATKFLAALFDTFNQQGLDYAVIRNFENLPHEIVGDLDILIDPDCLHKLKTILSGLEDSYGVTSVFKSGVWPHIQRTYYFNGENQALFKLDFQVFIGKAGFEYSSAKQFLMNKVKKDSFYVVSEKDQLVILLYHCIIYKKTFSSTYKARINEIFQKAEKGYYFEQQFSKELIEKIYQCLENENFDELLKLKFRIIFELLIFKKKNIITAPVTLAKWFIARILWGYLFPRGVFMAFIGPDGCGKTTIINTLHETLQYEPLSKVRKIEMGFQKNGVLPTEDFYRKYRNMPGFKFLWPFISLTDFYLRYFLKVRPTLGKGGVVLADRYIYNISTGDYKITKLHWVQTVLFAITPRPDICYIVHREPEAIEKDREERTVTELEKYYEQLESIPSHFVSTLENNDLELVIKTCVNDLIHVYLRKSSYEN